MAQLLAGRHREALQSFRAAVELGATGLVPLCLKLAHTLTTGTRLVPVHLDERQLMLPVSSATRDQIAASIHHVIGRLKSADDILGSEVFLARCGLIGLVGDSGGDALLTFAQSAENRPIVSWVADAEQRELLHRAVETTLGEAGSAIDVRPAPLSLEDIRAALAGQPGTAWQPMGLLCLDSAQAVSTLDICRRIGATVPVRAIVRVEPAEFDAVDRWTQDTGHGPAGRSFSEDDAMCLRFVFAPGTPAPAEPGLSGR